MGIKDLPWVKRSGSDYIIPRDRIKPGPWGNVRTEFPEETIAERANSLVLEGQKEVVKGCLSDDQEWFLLIDGELRWRAWEYAKDVLGVNLDEKSGGMKCRGIRKPATDIEISLLQFGYGTDTVPLSKVDQANAIKRFADTGMSIADIATRIRRSKQHVRDMIAFTSAPKEIREAVGCGAMRVTTAVKTVRATKAARDEIIDQVNQGKKVCGKDVADAMIAKAEEHQEETFDSEMISPETQMMSPEEVSKQIKYADKRMFLEKSEKGRLKYRSMIEAYRIVLRLADPLN